jgi:hypothetical protein
VGLGSSESDQFCTRKRESSCDENIAKTLESPIECSRIGPVFTPDIPIVVLASSAVYNNAKKSRTSVSIWLGLAVKCDLLT